MLRHVPFNPVATCFAVHTPIRHRRFVVGIMLFDKVPIQEYFTNLFKFDVEHDADNPNYRCLRGLIHVMVKSVL